MLTQIDGVEISGGLPQYGAFLNQKEYRIAVSSCVSVWHESQNDYDLSLSLHLVTFTHLPCHDASSRLLTV